MEFRLRKWLLKIALIGDILGSQQLPMRSEAQSSRKAYNAVISYACEDERLAARPLADTFKVRGFEVLPDRLMREANAKIENAILSGLHDCCCPVVVVSKDFLRKDPRKEELDILLALEEIDGPHRIVTVSHGVSDSKLRVMSPYRVGRTRLSTSAGIKTVCERMIQIATEYASTGARRCGEVDSFVPLASGRQGPKDSRSHAAGRRIPTTSGPDWLACEITSGLSGRPKTGKHLPGLAEVITNKDVAVWIGRRRSRVRRAMASFVQVHLKHTSGLCQAL